MAIQNHFAEFICLRMVPMAAKQGAHSRLNAPKAIMAPVPETIVPKACHISASPSPKSARLYRVPKVETTFSLAMRPVMVIEVACQESKPSGAKMMPTAPPNAARME